MRLEAPAREYNRATMVLNQHIRSTLIAVVIAGVAFGGAFGHFTLISGPVVITGVGFFDFLHGQTGVAPNGIELHPVLSIVLAPSGSATPTSSATPIPSGETATPTPSVTPTTVPTTTPATTEGPGVRRIADLNCDGGSDGLDVLMELKEIALLEPIRCGLELGMVPFNLDCTDGVGLADALELMYFVSQIPYPVSTPANCLPLDTFVATQGGK